MRSLLCCTVWCCAVCGNSLSDSVLCVRVCLSMRPSLSECVRVCLALSLSLIHCSRTFRSLHSLALNIPKPELRAAALSHTLTALRLPRSFTLKFNCLACLTLSLSYIRLLFAEINWRFISANQIITAKQANKAAKQRANKQQPTTTEAKLFAHNKL